MQSDFRVETHTTDRVTTVTVTGELDLVSSPTFETELERAIDSDCDVIVVDFRSLDFMDSTGLHVLIKGHHRALESKRVFAVTRGSDQVDRLLTLTGLADVMRIVDSPEHALETGHAPDGP
ncbi:MAG TPA: STAS domain-containing protein [Solirubrobacteraceae bacterium]|nr:STAS domain-containing protein [Solirubrobacteraceae bacterium]